MADLPDLDTQSASYAAYWNAIDDGGVQDIDPTDVTSHGNIESYELYDNGIEGTFDATALFRSSDTIYSDTYVWENRRSFNFRVKEDGWFVAWMEDNDTTYQHLGTYDGSIPGADAGGGYISTDGNYDVMMNWAAPAGSVNMEQNSLERVINQLQAELSNSSSLTYSPADAGLYDFAHDGTTLTAMSSMNKVTDTTTTHTYSFNYSAGTTVYEAYVTVAGAYDFGGSIDSYYETGGEFPIAHTDGSGSGEEFTFGQRDLTVNSGMLDAGTDLVTEVTHSSGGSAVQVPGHAAAMVKWG